MLFCIMRISSCIMHISRSLILMHVRMMHVSGSQIVLLGKKSWLHLHLFVELVFCPGRGGSNQFWKGGEKLRRRHAKRLRSNIALLTSASSSLQCNALAVQSHLHHLHWRSNRSWLVPREWSWSNLVSNTDAKI